MANRIIFGVCSKIAYLIDCKVSRVRWGIFILFLLFPSEIFSLYIFTALAFLFIDKVLEFDLFKDAKYSVKIHETKRKQHSSDNHNYFKL